MNLLTAIARIDRVQLRQTNDGRPIADLKLSLLNQDSSSIKMVGVAYGGVAEGLEERTIVLISGKLNVIQNPETKQSYPSVNVSSVVTIDGFSKGSATICLTGNMGQDPDVRHFESGKMNAKSSLAVRRTKDQTDWFAFEAWGKTAEIMDQYAVKGAKIGIWGELKQECWNDRTTGEARSKLVVVVREFDLLGSRADGTAEEPKREVTAQPRSKPPEDDIAF